MSAQEARPALGVDNPGERQQRRRAGWSMFVTPLLVAVIQLVDGYGSYDFSYVLRCATVFAVMGLYWLWLSTPRAGAARFEALITKNAAQAVPLALFIGALIGALFLH